MIGPKGRPSERNRKSRQGPMSLFHRPRSRNTRINQFLRASSSTFATVGLWNLMLSIKTMNWTEFRPCPNLTYEQIAILTTLGPSEHPHSALLPEKFQTLQNP